jgi:hypothetical protein
VSLKIYDAYRIKDSDKVWQVLAEIRERGQREVVDRLRAYYVDEIETVSPESDVYRVARARNPKQSEISLRLDLAETKLLEGAKKSATSMRRDHFDLDVDVAMTWHETGYYLRAFCDPVSMLGGSLDFLKSHPDLEDFHYQNQSDTPEGFEDRCEEWEDRGRIWNEMMVPPDSGMFKNQVVVEISNWTAFWHLNPCWDLRREYHDKPPTLPIREEVLARTLRKLKAIASVAAAPGLITAMTADGAAIIVRKASKRSQKGQWVTVIDGAIKAHANLERAVDRVALLFMDGYMKRLYERFRREAVEAKRAKKARKRM